MKLHQLFSMMDLVKAQVYGLTIDSNEFEITGIFFEAQKVIPDSIFVAIRGSKTDGHQFLNEAVEHKAKILIVELTDQIPKSFSGTVFQVKESRSILDSLAAEFYQRPSEKLFIFGVTGTNGKTSITYLLEHILKDANKKIGVMGTVNHRIDEKIWQSQMTTPDPVTLQSRLKDFVACQAFAAALEVSSHALDQNRTDSVDFNTVIFTNLTLDHLDYHKNIQNYFLAKQKLFTDLLWSSRKNNLFAVINVDDDYGRKLKISDRAIIWSYGQSESDFQFKILKMTFNETFFELKTPIENMQFKLMIPGIHTVYNAVASIVAALTAGIPLADSKKALESFKGIPGRLEKIDNELNQIIFVDYAHTPDALKNTLESIQKIKKETQSAGQIITVFGCGGDRDQTKRPLMAEIACDLSQTVIITSDNPRTENPDLIIQQIKVGVPHHFKNYFCIFDREEAIHKAITLACKDDIILIAGKGHEDYQIIGTEKIHFSDSEIAIKITGRLHHG